MKRIIGKRLLTTIKPESKPYDIRDTRLTGFLLRVQPTGRMAYYCEYARGKKYFIGKAEVVNPDDAREIARQTLADFTNGMDPNEIKRSAKSHDLSSFLKNEYGPWVTTHRKSGEATLSRLKACFEEPFGKKKLDEINAWVLQKWQTDRLKKKVNASTINRDITALKAALSKAVEWGILSTNPLSKVKRLKIDNSPKVRYLSNTEEYRLREALDVREESIRARRDRFNRWRKERKHNVLTDLRTLPFADKMKPMVLLSINTGLRRGELFHLKWEDINFNQATLTVMGESTKSGSTRHIPLNQEALATLKDWQSQNKKSDSPLVFPGKDGHPLDNINSAWRVIIKNANVGEFRWHDLRHHFASRLVMAGVDLNTVRELLGHSDLKMTIRYAHLAPEHKAAAVALLNK